MAVVGTGALWEVRRKFDSRLLSLVETLGPAATMESTAWEGHGVSAESSANPADFHKHLCNKEQGPGRKGLLWFIRGELIVAFQYLKEPTRKMGRDLGQGPDVTGQGGMASL